MIKKNILVYAYLYKRLDDMILFTSKMKSEFNIIFIIHSDNYISLLEKNNMNYINASRHSNLNKVSQYIFDKIIYKSMMQKFLIGIRKFSIGQYINERIFHFECSHYANISQIIMQESKIDLFVTITDRFLRPKEAGIFVASKNLNIPIFLPYLIRWNPEANYLMVKESPKYTLTNNSSSYQKKVFQNYSYQSYKNHYFYQAFHFKVLDKLGILSKMPWRSGGSISKIVAVSNKLSFMEHEDLGIDSKKLKILGDLSCIPLYDAFKDKESIKIKTIKKYNLKNKNIIIISLANWWEHGMADEKTHWDIVKNTIESTLKIISKDYSLLISLHPSMKLENYKFLESKYPLNLLEERLVNILPIADIYVSDQSSTVPWAIICEIKVLIICYYRDLNLFSDFSSIVYAKQENEIAEKLSHLLSSQISFDQDLELLSRDTLFNNSIIQNYIDTINKIIENK